MDKIWLRDVIKYLQENGLFSKDIHAHVIATLDDDAPALSIVQKWEAEVRRGRKSLEADPKSRVPATVITGENIWSYSSHGKG